MTEPFSPETTLGVLTSAIFDQIRVDWNPS